jgi:hypothetical protein
MPILRLVPRWLALLAVGIFSAGVVVVIADDLPPDSFGRFCA